MKRVQLLCLQTGHLLAAALVAFGLMVGTTAVSADPATVSSAPMPIYKPPFVGAPKSTVGGGTRGGANATDIVMLAPQDIALTVNKEPTLFWHLAKPAKVRLTIAARANPGLILLDKTFASADEGLQLHKLDANEITIKPGTEYKWVVEVVTTSYETPVQPKMGIIKMVNADPKLAKALKDANVSQHATIYAQHGIWYDAVERLGYMITAAPSEELFQQLEGLLAQVGITEF